MLNQWKSITVFLDESSQSDQIGFYAAELASRYASHLIGIYSLSRSKPDRIAGVHARGVSAIHDVISKLQYRDENKALQAGRHLAHLSQKFNISIEFRVIWDDGADNDTILHSIHSDLVMLGHPHTIGLPRNCTPERLVMETGVPVLLVPNQWDKPVIAQRVLIAWNGSREARRAIADALPFISNAEAVTVLVIDAEQRENAHGDEPGADLAHYLARHGAKVDVVQFSSQGQAIEEIIRNLAKSRSIDMLVIGAYSSSRMKERIFGGVTHTLLKEESLLPLFVSR